MQSTRAPCASIFLPKQELGHGFSASAGYLIGFNPHSFMCTIASVQAGVSLTTLEEALAALSADPALRALLAHCGGAPSVIGAYLPRGSDAELRPLSPGDRSDVAELWLTLVGSPQAGGLPSLREVHCCGCRHRAPLQLFLFRRSSRADEEWRSQLSLRNPWEDVEGSPGHSMTEQEQAIAQEMVEEMTQEELWNKEMAEEADDDVEKTTEEMATTEMAMKMATTEMAKKMAMEMSPPPPQPALRPGGAASELEMTLRQVSCSGELHRALTARLASLACKNSTAAEQHARSLSPSVLLSRLIRWLGRWLGRVLRFFVAPYLLALRALAGVWLRCMRHEVLPGVAVVRLSYAARQADARLVRALEWPSRWGALRGRAAWQPGARVERTHACGELTCALIDVAIGVALAVALVTWRDEVCRRAGVMHLAVHETWLPGRVQWLMGVDPGGFKLNENLNRALGSCVLTLLRAWHESITLLLALLPPPQSLLFLLVPGCCLGASVGVAILSDALAFSSLHLRQLYRAIAALYACYCSALYSLFNLFRGTKYNVLRQRVDSCDYDIEQRLLGTLFFTVLVFLFPTVVAYHVLATLMWLAILLVQSLLMLLLLMLEDFPWYELIQRLFVSGGLQGGVRFTPLWNTRELGGGGGGGGGGGDGAPPRGAGGSSQPGGAAHFDVEPQVASLAPCFSRHRSVVAGLLRHYSLSYLVRCLLLGERCLPAPERDLLLEHPPTRSRRLTLPPKKKVAAGGHAD